MKLSEYIAGLTKFLGEEGDLECFYASDDEGNSYQRVSFCGSTLYTNEPGEYNPSMYCEEDLEEYGDEADDFVKICVVN